MSKANLGWLYYKEMYRKGDDVQHINNALNQIFKASGSDESLDSEHSFKLKTIYPGLIIGSGYAHGVKVDEDSKIGFYFDHTSGIPTIPGSSVKGTLRSLFGFHTNKKDTYQDEKEAFIRDLTGKSELDVKLLVDDIFEGKNEKGDAKSIYDRDIFYEARVVSNLTIKDDYLAPHKEPLKNPIPIKFIKIAGGVSFEFSFKLHDGGGLTADEKLELFFQLLQFSGVGAKTNVGYGQFESKELSKFQAELKIQKEVLLHEQTQRLEQLKQEKEQKEQKELQEGLKNADTLAKQVALFIQNKSENKEIFDYLETLEIPESEKEDVLLVVTKKIGSKPEDTPKNMKKAKTKWPLKIYKLFEE